MTTGSTRRPHESQATRLAPSVPQTETGDGKQISSEWTNRLGVVRDLTDDLSGTVRAAQDAVRWRDIDVRGRQLMRAGGVLDGVTRLADDGMSWAQIALALGVTDAAIRKWRNGRSEPNPDMTPRVGRLLAFKEWFDAHAPHFHGDFAAWMETPVLPDVHVTPAHVYATDGGLRLLVEHMDPRHERWELVLDAAAPGWRERRERGRRFEVVTTAHGERVLAYRGESR